MHILERINEYTQNIKKTPYVYAIQKTGIESIVDYINVNKLDVDEADFNRTIINKLILYWIPKNKKYMSEIEAYQIIYTIQDICNYILNGKMTNKAVRTKKEEVPTILELYGQEYMRAYKAKNMLLRLTRDPVISLNPMVIDINKYRDKKNKEGRSERATTYEQALFRVAQCKEGGQIILNKLNQNKEYKILLEYPVYKYLKEGDFLHAVIKKKLFYVYWEIDEIKSYYLPDADAFFK